MRLAMYQGRPYFVQPKGNQLLGARIDAANVVTLIRHPAELARLSSEIKYDVKLDPAKLRAPIRLPHQIFALAGNFEDHQQERQLPVSDMPVVFSKSASSITGPRPRVTLPSDTVDWETELVVVLGKRVHDCDLRAAQSAVFGYMVGQDLTDRSLEDQHELLLSKSYPRFSAIGPWITTTDELPEGIGDLRLETHVNGIRKQAAALKQMIFTVPQVIQYLSQAVTLLPGDLIFMGTPSGVGFAHQPKQYIKPDDFIDSQIDGLGTLSATFVMNGREVLRQQQQDALDEKAAVTN
ncbi:fumarylacetoacetate hydrolase family protein [Lacticaseibacillus hulanensis]|uniref:fumarylacetoacetate hydrolase family protein n=1 Tax=Lacticaseibacillus hulanensis TaxID=2493111 RepID=UPI000FDB6059|nr:fumarylacetoacetate hydrolase family protein [Lacticaseibacillus hulanensis]